MASERWTDLLRSGVRAVSRRDIARSVAGLGAGLIGAVGPSVYGKGNGRKKKAGGKAKGKKKPPAKPVRDICDATWPDAHNREYCRFIRRQCNEGVRREFCIIEGDPNDPAKVAVCCPEGESCCDGACVDLELDSVHCGACGEGCGVGELCFEGQCVSFCGPGGTPCPGAATQCCRDGKTCCNGRCIDTTGDDNNCGQCGKRCRKPGYPRNEVCIAGECVCWAAGTVWDESCGGCNDPATWRCCDVGGSACPVTHDCVMLGTRPNGDPIWGCVGRPQSTG